jgi:hypothetical protein
MNHDTGANPVPCEECVLMQLVPPEQRGAKFHAAISRSQKRVRHWRISTGAGLRKRSKMRCGTGCEAPFNRLSRRELEARPFAVRSGFRVTSFTSMSKAGALRERWEAFCRLGSNPLEGRRFAKTAERARRDEHHMCGEARLHLEACGSHPDH